MRRFSTLHSEPRDTRIPTHILMPIAPLKLESSSLTPGLSSKLMPFSAANRLTFTPLVDDFSYPGLKLRSPSNALLFTHARRTTIDVLTRMSPVAEGPPCLRRFDNKSSCLQYLRIETLKSTGKIPAFNSKDGYQPYRPAAFSCTCVPRRSFLILSFTFLCRSRMPESRVIQ